MSLDLLIRANTKDAKKKIDRLGKDGSRSIKKLEKSTTGLSSALGKLGLGLSLVGVVAGLRKVTRLAGIQEKAYARLNANIENVLVSFKGYEKNTEELNFQLKRNVDLLTEQANKLQNLTTFGDEQIMSGQAMLATFALTSNEILKLTPRILDMAAAQEKATGAGVQLEDVAISVGKALATNTLGGLKRVGVVMDSTTESMFKQASAGDKLSILLGVLDDNYKGVAEAIGQTDAGKLERIGNIFGDVGEAIGNIVLDDALLSGIERLALGLKSLTEFDKPKVSTATDTIERQTQAVAAQIMLLEDGIDTTDRYRNELNLLVETEGLELDNLKSLQAELEKLLSLRETAAQIDKEQTEKAAPQTYY